MNLQIDFLCVYVCVCVYDGPIVSGHGHGAAVANRRVNDWKDTWYLSKYAWLKWNVCGVASASWIQWNESNSDVRARGIEPSKYTRQTRKRMLK